MRIRNPTNHAGVAAKSLSAAAIAKKASRQRRAIDSEKVPPEV